MARRIVRQPRKKKTQGTISSERLGLICKGKGTKATTARAAAQYSIKNAAGKENPICCKVHALLPVVVL